MKKLFHTSALTAVAAFALLAAPAVASADPTQIQMKDDCEATTFNAVIGPGTCVGHGGTTFADFIGQLVDHKFAAAWRFSPKQVNIDAGSSVSVVNRGGETHTFTQATQFGGGGIVAGINTILFGTQTPPTFFFGPPRFVPAGGSTTVTPETLTPGTHLFICIIHPWMEETVVVR